MEEHIRKVDTNWMLSSTIGRAMNILLSSRPRKLEDAISRIGLSSQRSSSGSGSLEESLRFLREYVRDAADRMEPLDQILVPMIENSVKCKGLKHGNHVMILLNWLFQDELLFHVLASNLAEIIKRKEDHYILLGWCILISRLLDYEVASNKVLHIGIREKQNTLLKILCPTISRLSSIICSGSTLQNGFELPTRLSVAAADCTLLLTEALIKKTPSSEVSSSRTKPSDPNAANWQISLVPTASSDKRVMSTSKFSQASESMEMEFLLWNHFDELIILVQKLCAWNTKSRPLHAKGLELVLKWLQEIKQHYASLEDEAEILKTGVLLLSSCWKHYSMLLHLEDHGLSQKYGELLNQYLSGIQFYMDDYTAEHSANKNSGIGTNIFFLTCISLLLGRLDNKQFEIAISEYGSHISCVVLSQLQCIDEDVIEIAVCILKETIFKKISSGRNIFDTRQLEAVMPLLLNLLDERDSPTRAVVMLTAECCSMFAKSGDGWCVQEVLKRLVSGNISQRQNAMNVVSELIHISLDSVNLLSHSMWQDIANHLLECLEDKELTLRVQASNLFPKIDPPFVLPKLVRLVYSPNKAVQSSASDALIAVLKHHNQNLEVMVLLLDCLSNLSKSIDLPKVPGEIEGVSPSGSKLDANKVLRLIPEWSKSVQDWNIFIEPLIDKFFKEPENAIVVRFLSCISEHLADAADVVLHRVLLHMQAQGEMDETFFSREGSGSYSSNDPAKFQHSLFDRLCPLLIIRLLPLRIFNDLCYSLMYDQLNYQEFFSEERDFNLNSDTCIAALLIKRAFHKFEFEDVRKLAAELCGRIHPQVLFPVIWFQLKNASQCHNIPKIKACLFSVCTSLVVRGRDSAQHPVMPKIRKILESVLLWPPLDGDEVSKAQHGCIDCLALMICAELQAPESSKDPPCDKVGMFRKKNYPGSATVSNSVLAYVIQQLTFCGSKSISDPSDSNSTEFGCVSQPSTPLSFRLCMANVLISACQKISSSSKFALAQKILPVLVQSTERLTDSEVRAACIQVLFSAVYHLKSLVLPYSSELLKISIKALQKGAWKERMAGAKLMASLMASEDAVVESISGGLLEARSVLASISFTDPSLELQQVCQKLLVCITSPLDSVLRDLSL
ncbi:PREDICTED: uncharacterized protein LOC104597470 isoform X2 [Nelumbo nucifera]|uniref:Uncharacterized protein LOC104597470 isoform X2 n=1 Tax=Nelumbo nucifera TaxID=4432 RepID=A0A1U7ZYB3_NELNU|nr:PREDICTED: uncharacterized protein LOC104597470 isoform X2 [Nelumbo nucifera]